MKKLTVDFLHVNPGFKYGLTALGYVRGWISNPVFILSMQIVLKIQGKAPLEKMADLFIADFL